MEKSIPSSSKFTELNWDFDSFFWTSLRHFVIHLPLHRVLYKTGLNVLTCITLWPLTIRDSKTSDQGLLSLFLFSIQCYQNDCFLLLNLLDPQYSTTIKLCNNEWSKLRFLLTKQDFLAVYMVCYLFYSIFFILCLSCYILLEMLW